MTTDYGECVITLIGDELRIDRADATVLITAELLDEIAANPPEHPAQLRDGVLTIRGINKTVTYRIGEYDTERQAHRAERI